MSHRRLKPRINVTSAASLRKWAAYQFDISLSLATAQKILDDDKKGHYWDTMRQLSATIWNETSTEITRIKFRLLAYAPQQGTAPPFQRPVIDPNRPNYVLNVNPTVVPPLRAQIINDWMSPYQEVAWRRREDFIGELDVNEFIL